MGDGQIWVNKIRGKIRGNKQGNKQGNKKKSQFRVYTGSEGTLFPQRKNRAPHENRLHAFLTHSSSTIYKQLPPPPARVSFITFDGLRALRAYFILRSLQLYPFTIYLIVLFLEVSDFIQSFHLLHWCFCIH